MEHLSAPDHSSFVYDALDPQQKQIRLLKLHQDTEMIQCSMRTINLKHDHTARDYPCLSYMWGEDTSKTILVNGCSFRIRENLYNCLKVLVARGFEHEIWIDQICIEQSAIAERTHQVNMMADIFEGAAEVIVWLHVTCEKERASLVKLQSPPCVQPGWCPEISDLEAELECLHNAYFSRTWIVQELVLAKDITIHSDVAVAPWRHLRVAAEALHTLKRKYGYVWCPFYSGTIFEFQGRGRASSPLVSLLQWFVFSKCSDQRDVVFALLSLAKQGREPVVADYSKTPAFVLLETVGAVVRDLEDTGHFDRNSSEMRFCFDHLADRLVPGIYSKISALYSKKTFSNFYKELDDREFQKQVAKKCLDTWLCEQLEEFLHSLGLLEELMTCGN